MKFTDSKGNDWEIKIDEECIYAMRIVAGRDLFRGPFDVPTDSGVLVKCIALSCYADWNERGITPEAFLGIFDGPTLTAAIDAFLREYFAFWKPIFPHAASEALRYWQETQSLMAIKRRAAKKSLGAA